MLDPITKVLHSSGVMESCLVQFWNNPTSAELEWERSLWKNAEQTWSTWIVSAERVTTFDAVAGQENCEKK